MNKARRCSAGPMSETENGQATAYRTPPETERYMNHPTQRTLRIRDIHHLYDVVDENPAGIPMPSVGRDGRASFNFSMVRDPGETQAGMRLAEAILTRHLGLVFEDRPVDVAGSAAYWVRTAHMPSGLYVDLVALAAHKPAGDAGNVRKLVAA